MKGFQQETALLLYNVFIMSEITQFQIVWIDKIHSNLPVHLNFLARSYVWRIWQCWRQNMLTFSLNLHKVSQSQSHGLWVQTVEGLCSACTSDRWSIQLSVICNLGWVLRTRQASHVYHLEKTNALKIWQWVFFTTFAGY